MANKTQNGMRIVFVKTECSKETRYLKHFFLFIIISFYKYFLRELSLRVTPHFHGYGLHLKKNYNRSLVGYKPPNCPSIN